MSVTKYLVAEKCKPYEIYKRMCVIYGEACLSKKNVYEWGDCLKKFEIVFKMKTGKARQAYNGDHTWNGGFSRQ